MYILELYITETLRGTNYVQVKRNGEEAQVSDVLGCSILYPYKGWTNFSRGFPRNISRGSEENFRIFPGGFVESVLFPRV